MSQKINRRIVNKHDIEFNWKRAVNFVPYRGELIVYDADENYSVPRLKIGDGNTNVNDLPFVERDFASPIRNTIAGGDKNLIINDVSPITHKCSLRLISDVQEPSRNLYNETSHTVYIEGDGSVHSGYKCTTNEDGSVTITGNGNIDMGYEFGIVHVEGIIGFQFKNLIPGETYTFSVRSNVENDGITTNPSWDGQ